MIGFLLVGGEGRRLGGNKAQQLFAGRPLYQYAWENLHSFCSRVIMLGQYPPCPGEVWCESSPGQGPLGAIRYALQRSPEDWNLVLAVDYPYLGAAVWERLLPLQGKARLPRCEGQVHPLAGFYHRSCGLEHPSGSVVKALAQEKGVEWVDFNDPQPFLNVNRPQDLR